MKTQQAAKALNQALKIEYAGIIQYLQSAQLVQGAQRELHERFFTKMSEECWKHAELVGKWLVVLNSVPTVEPAPIRQSTDLTEMLRQSLELEREAQTAYLEALTEADDPALRLFVEQMVHDERLHTDELEKLLGLKTLSVALKEVKLRPA